MDNDKGAPMGSCGGCDGSLSDRKDSSTAGKSVGVGSGMVETVKNGAVLNNEKRSGM